MTSPVKIARMYICTLALRQRCKNIFLSHHVIALYLIAGKVVSGNHMQPYHG